MIYYNIVITIIYCDHSTVSNDRVININTYYEENNYFDTRYLNGFQYSYFLQSCRYVSVQDLFTTIIFDLLIYSKIHKTNGVITFLQTHHSHAYNAYNYSFPHLYNIIRYNTTIFILRVQYYYSYERFKFAYYNTLIYTIQHIIIIYTFHTIHTIAKYAQHFSVLHNVIYSLFCRTVVYRYRDDQTTPFFAKLPRVVFSYAYSCTIRLPPRHGRGLLLPAIRSILFSQSFVKTLIRRYTDDDM